MKSTILFIVIVSISITLHATEPLTGYVVLENNDTIKCKIKSGRFLGNPFRGITIINEQGKIEPLPSREKKIIAFGFVEYLKSYHFMYVDVGDKAESGFYQRLVNGLKYKLYSNPPRVYGANPTYVLFNPAGELKYFEVCVLCPWKKKLRELLRDDPKALALVENALRTDIPRFVLEINKL